MAKVKITKLDLFDEDRIRKVPVKIYMPETEDGQKRPCVFWSHGLGGSRDGASFLARYISEAGFIVIHMTHIGTDTSLWEGKPGHPWDVIRAQHISRKVTLQRFRDPSFVLDEITRRAEAGETPFTYIDQDRIGMSGHSFGAVTTQIVAGQMLGKGRRRYSLRDPRFRAGIAYSLGPTYNKDEPAEDIYGPISMPMLYMTGTQDDSPTSGADYTSRLPIFEAAQGPDQYLLVLDGGDHMVFAGSRGGLKENPKRETHERIICETSLIFWNAHLRQDKTAQDWLSGKGAAKDYDSEIRWKSRNA